MTHKFKACPWGSQPDRTERAEREVVANEPRYEKYKQITRKKNEREERKRKKETSQEQGDDVTTHPASAKLNQNAEIPQAYVACAGTFP